MSGVSRNIPERFYQHEVYKRWWPHVARKTMSWYGSRRAALAAEAAAIASECPVYNITGVSSEEDDPIPKTGRRRNWSVSAKEAEAKLSAWGKGAANSSPESSAKPPRDDPAYVQIARHLEAMIRSGDLPANVKLPQDSILGEWYAAGPGTVGKAGYCKSGAWWSGATAGEHSSASSCPQRASRPRSGRRTSQGSAAVR